MSRGYGFERITAQLVGVELDPVYRLIRRQHRRRPLGVVPAPSRFSDPNGQYAVLYAAESVRCSFWEALGRNRFTRKKRRELPLAEVKGRVVATLRSVEPLALVDLRGDGAVRIGAPPGVANHAAGRTLSAVTHARVPEADGFLYHSRFTGHACVAIFSRALRRLEALALQTSCFRAELLRRCLWGACLKSTVDAQALYEVSRVHANLNRVGGLLKLAIREGVSDPSGHNRLNHELREAVREVSRGSNMDVHGAPILLFSPTCASSEPRPGRNR